MLSTRLHASPSRRGVPAQLPLGSTEQQLSLALISPGSLVSAMSERFVRGALGTRGGPHPRPCALRGAGNHPSGSGRVPAGAWQWVAERCPCRGRPRRYLHQGGLAGELVPGALVLGLDVALRPVQHRAAHVLVHYVGAPVPGGEGQCLSGPPGSAARPARLIPAGPAALPGRAVLTCCGSPAGSTAGAGCRG